MLRAILNSAIISVSTLVLTLVLAAPAAYALARRRLRFTAVVVFVLLLAQMVPTVIIAGPLFVIFGQIGLVDSYLALILADTTIITLPFAMIILRPFFLSVPRDLEDAALIDGCSRPGALWRVVLPVVLPGLITVGTFAFLLSWGEFVFGLTLITSEELQPVTVALSEIQGQYSTRWNNLMAVPPPCAAHRRDLRQPAALYRERPYRRGYQGVAGGRISKSGRSPKPGSGRQEARLLVCVGV